MYGNLTTGVRWFADWPEATNLPAAPGAEAPGIEVFMRQRPAAHGVVLDRGRVAARCSVWTSGAVKRQWWPNSETGADRLAAHPEAITATATEATLWATCGRPPRKSWG